MLMPYLIEFDTVGEEGTGFLTYAQTDSKIPFEVKRVYWVYGTQNDSIRGNHAYKVGEQVIIAMKGDIRIHLEDKFGKVFEFVLTKASQGLYVPGTLWRKAFMNEGSILLTLSSEIYSEENYVRNYQEFKQ